MYNLAREVREYEELFYNKYVMVIIKIYDDAKIWDADNRNVKPIHDGLIHGKIIAVKIYTFLDFLCIILVIKKIRKIFKNGNC